MMFTLKVIICGYVHAVSWFLYTAYPHTHTLAASTIHEHKKKHAWSLVSFISPLCSFHHWKSFPLRCMVNECVFQFASHETRLVMAPLQQSTWFSHQRTPPGCESSFENSSKDFCWYLGRSKTFIVHWCMIWYNWYVLSSWPVITIFTTDLFWCFQPLSGTTRCDNFNEMTRNEDFFNQETGRFAIKCANRTTSKRVIGPSIDSMAKNRKHLCDMFGWKFKAVNPSGPYVQGFLFQSFFETVLQKRTCSNTHRWMFPAFPHASQFLRLLKPKNPAVFIRKKKTKTLGSLPACMMPPWVLNMGSAEIGEISNHGRFLFPCPVAFETHRHEIAVIQSAWKGPTIWSNSLVAAWNISWSKNSWFPHIGGFQTKTNIKQFHYEPNTNTGMKSEWKKKHWKNTTDQDSWRRHCIAAAISFPLLFLLSRLGQLNTEKKAGGKNNPRSMGNVETELPE